MGVRAGLVVEEVELPVGMGTFSTEIRNELLSGRPPDAEMNSSDCPKLAPMGPEAAR